jgi:hypothetical protein
MDSYSGVLSLGPMPEAVRVLVRRLVAYEGEPHGFLLTSGPGVCSYLDADGRVWNCSTWDDTIELVLDGPLMVGLVAIGAERVPGLAAWLPARPLGAPDCQFCGGLGWLPPPLPRVQCPDCYGMGWVEPANTPSGDLGLDRQESPA